MTVLNLRATSATRTIRPCGLRTPAAFERSR